MLVAVGGGAAAAAGALALAPAPAPALAADVVVWSREAASLRIQQLQLLNPEPIRARVHVLKR